LEGPVRAIVKNIPINTWNNENTIRFCKQYKEFIGKVINVEEDIDGDYVQDAYMDKDGDRCVNVYTKDWLDFNIKGSLIQRRSFPTLRTDN
jgi:hypothetical protein